MLRPLLLATALALLLALAGPAVGATPAERFNAPGQRHVNVCARPSSPTAALRYADASTTGFMLDDRRVFDDGRCAAGTLRLDLHELIPSPAGPLVFHRGGNGYDDDQNVKYGELATSALAGPLPAPVLSRGGRGAPCDLAAGPAYQVSVRSIPAAMHYKRPQDLASGSNNGASFLHYGDPGADQGEVKSIHYSYLLWSFPNVRGGGIVRTLLADDQDVRLCDVAPIVMNSWDRAGAVNGQVTARYVRMLAGSCPLYGWMVWSHDDLTDSSGPVAHARTAASAPAPDPAPAGDCPVQEAATAPAVTAAGPSDVAETAATLAGSIDPAGVNGSWRFEYGFGAEYGSSTADLPLAPDIVPSAKSARVDGLQPGTTYHYRLVATSTHGTTYGPDTTFTTPASPAPPPPPPPPPPSERVDPSATVASATPTAAPVELTALRLTPATLKRSRTRNGGPALISWAATRSARVTLSFERRAPGMRVGAACRALPRAGIRRGARRCARWARVAGTLRTTAASSAGTLRFGGWAGPRRLALGSYRLRAVARGDDGLPSRARYASFKLR